jgi:hypothetical protein
VPTICAHFSEVRFGARCGEVPLVRGRDTPDWFTVHASHPSGGSTTPTVQKGGSLHATLEGGGQQTVVCNDGNLHADGDGGTFTVTGHCVTLTITGDNIHVTVDSADTINVEGVGTEVAQGWKWGVQLVFQDF